MSLSLRPLSFLYSATSSTACILLTKSSAISRSISLIFFLALSSELFPGIGKKAAEKVFDALGEEALKQLTDGLKEVAKKYKGEIENFIGA